MADDGTIASGAAVGAAGAALWGKPAAQRIALPSAGCRRASAIAQGTAASALLHC